jgi:hypothetical protein
MHAITPGLFSKIVYSVPLRLRALRLRGCVRLDRGGGGGGGGGRGGGGGGGGGVVTVSRLAQKTANSAMYK